MADFDTLGRLFNPTLIEDIGTRSGRSFVRLKEAGSDAKLKKVDILDLGENSVVLKLDRCDPARRLFSCSCGEGRRCDYLIVMEMQGMKYLLFVELKSGRVPMSVIKQFKGAESIIAYCADVLERFYGASGLFDSYERRFVCFYKPSIAKRTTRPTRPGRHSKTHSSPENMWRYPNPVNPSIAQLL